MTCRSTEPPGITVLSDTAYWRTRQRGRDPGHFGFASAFNAWPAWCARDGLHGHAGLAVVPDETFLKAMLPKWLCS